MKTAFLAALVLTSSLATVVWSDTAVVLSTDFSTAYYSTLPVQPPWNPNVDIESTCPDASVRSSNGVVVLVGRFGCDFVQVLDPNTGFATTGQWSTGNGTNPQDIAVCSPTKAYVSLYERDHLLILNPQNGQHLGEIDLSMFGDADGLPEAVEMLRVGNRVFVALQRLDRMQGFAAVNTSYLAVVDCSTDALVDVDPATPGVQGIPLSAPNPFDELVFDPVRQKIVVSEVGMWEELDGGIEFVDPVTFAASGLQVSEATLGGDVNRARLYVDCNGYAIVTDPSFNTRLVRFDWCSGTLSQTCHTTSGFRLSDLEISSGGRVLVTERDLQAPGVRIFAAPGCQQLTAQPISFGLPPQDLTLVGDCDATPTDVEVLAAGGARLLRNWPDPFRPWTTLLVEAPAGASLIVDVVDVRGRVVRVLWEGNAASRRWPIEWRGTDGAGQPVPSGVYFARLRSGGLLQVERMTLLR